MISGTAASGYAGIYVEGFDDVKLKDCEIVNFYHGIKLRDSQYSVITSNDIHDTSIGVTVSYYSRDNLVHGNSLYNNNDDGLYLDNNCNRNNLTNNTISHNSDVGIYLVTNCQNNRISDNDIHSNLDDGIEFNGGSNYNVIYGNRIHDHIDDGFWIQGNSRYNTFFDNILYANGDNAYEDSTSNSNSWNSTIGNDWDDFASNPGYPYTYEIAGPGDGVDYHPVGADEVPQCGSTITTDTTLTEDLLDCPGHGLIIGTDNITLDCMGHWIMGEGFNMHGIRIEADHTTVRNCNVEFFRGIVVHGQHNLIEGNYVQNADGAMFTNPGYDHNTFRDNEATGSYYGINLDSNYNIMTGNILHGNDPYDLHVSPIDATGNLIYGNDFGPNVHEAESGNMWNLSTVGNLWSDFESNPGYPTHYEVPGPGNGVDWHPLNYVPDQFIDLYLTCDDIFLSEDDVLINTTVTITALIHNDLQDNPESFVVRFYSGPPAQDNVIGEQRIYHNRDMYVGQTEWMPTIEGDYDIHVWADPDNEIEEMDEENNIASTALHVFTKPDIKIDDDDIYFSDNNPDIGNEITIFAQLRNLESEPTGDFFVRFYDSDWSNLIARMPFSMEGNEANVAMATWTATVGLHEIHVVADSTGIVDEWDETNNEGKKSLQVRRPIYHQTSSPLFMKEPAIHS